MSWKWVAFQAEEAQRKLRRQNGEDTGEQRFLLKVRGHWPEAGGRFTVHTNPMGGT